jgi:CRP/FNR family cyclic AMP-dependent transcriptional regulator
MLKQRVNGATLNGRTLGRRPLNGSAPPDLADLASRMMARRYERGRILYMPDERCKTLFLLYQGHVHLYHLSIDGRKFVVNVLKPGDVFGATSLSPAYRPRVFAETADECVIGALDTSYAREWLLAEPRAALLMIDRLGRQLTQVENKLETMALHPLAVRLARFLLESARDNAVQDYTHQDLGEIVGAYRESITVMLNRFKDDGLIDIDRRCIEILDRGRLTALAWGESGSPAAHPNGQL